VTGDPTLGNLGATMNRFLTRIAHAAWLVVGASILAVIGLAMLVCPDGSADSPLGAKYRRLPAAPG
jgi:hypothetical protein